MDNLLYKKTVQEIAIRYFLNSLFTNKYFLRYGSLTFFTQYYITAYRQIFSLGPYHKHI